MDPTSEPAKAQQSPKESVSAVPDAVATAIEDLRKVDAFRLVIPEYTPRARNWAPHAFVPSTVLSRVVPPVTAEAVPKVVEPSDDPSMEIVLDEFLGQHKNETTDAYRASLRRGPDDTTPGLIVKILDLTMLGPLAGAQSALFEMFHAQEKAASLQGTVLPRMAGLFGRGTLFCFVFEDAGDEVPFDEMYEESVRTEIRSAIDRLFDTDLALIVTEGAGWGYFRCGRDGRIKIAHLSNAYDITEMDNKPAWREDVHEMLRGWFLGTFEP